MRSLLNSSQPFICSEGINTPLEAISFGKIPFLEFMDNNRDFFPTYKHAVLDEIPAQFHAEAKEFFHLYLRKNRMNLAEQEQLKSLLNNREFCETLIKTNLMVFNKLPNPAERIATELHAPGKPNPNYTGDAFGSDVKTISNLLFDLLLLENLINQSKATSKNSPPTNSFFGAKKSPLFNNNMFSIGSPKFERDQFLAPRMGVR
jgi:hypothetical protein